MSGERIHFSQLSREAQSAIVDAVLDIDTPNLSESAKEEIRQWVTPPAAVAKIHAVLDEVEGKE